jgi:hypothetical protein
VVSLREAETVMLSESLYQLHFQSCPIELIYAKRLLTTCKVDGFLPRSFSSTQSVLCKYLLFALTFQLLYVLSTDALPRNIEISVGSSRIGFQCMQYAVAYLICLMLDGVRLDAYASCFPAGLWP